MNRLYLDCEYNGFGGELISIALVSEDYYYDRSNRHLFYKVVGYDVRNIHPWVQKNVIPYLNVDPVPYAIAQVELFRFLEGYKHPHIICDWPEDLIHFNRMLLRGPGMRHGYHSKITMEVDGSIEVQGEVPHNALSDAIAIMNFDVERRLGQKPFF